MWLLPLWLSLSLAQSPPTGALSGIVLDEDELPILTATVSLESPRLLGGVQVVTTDEEGRFRVRNLPSGLYTVTAERSGYMTTRVVDLQVHPERIAVVRIELSPFSDEPPRPSPPRPAVDLSTGDSGRTLEQGTLQRLPR